MCFTPPADEIRSAHRRLRSCAWPAMDCCTVSRNLERLPHVPYASGRGDNRSAPETEQHCIPIGGLSRRYAVGFGYVHLLSVICGVGSSTPSAMALLVTRCIS